MKVCAFPSNIPVPAIDVLIKQGTAVYQQQEDAALAACKAHLLSLGYTGSCTGKEYTIPMGDGAARYMVAEGPTGSMILVHLPFMDAWDSPFARRVTKGDVRKQVNRVPLFGTVRVPAAPTI